MFLAARVKKTCTVKSCLYFVGFLCVRDEDTKASDSFIKRRFTSPKSGIISSFLEDCLSVDSDPKVAVSPWALLGHINLFVLFFRKEVI